VPEWLDRTAAYGWRLLVIAAAVIVLALAVSQLLVVLIPVVVAAMVATVLLPPARWLRRRGWPSLAATWAVFLGALAGFGGFVFWLVSTIAADYSSLHKTATGGVHRVQRWLVRGPLHLARADVRHAFNRVGHDLATHGGGLALRGAALAAELVVGTLLSLVITFFLVKDGDRLLSAMCRVAGTSRERRLRQVAERTWETLTGYVRGTTVNGAVNGVLMGAGLYALGVPLALPLGALTFFGGYLPIVGSIVTGTLAALIALVTHGVVRAALVVGLSLLVHNVEGYLVGPLVLGRAVHLHPVAVLLTLAIGSVIAGVIGVFLAVPFVAITFAIVDSLRVGLSEG
jgi:predicted PurR-regulated permease PerM